MVEGVARKKNSKELRVCSFNVNGLNTLFNYHPWSTLQDLDQVFEYLDADIITFQELKLSKITNKALAKKYHNFITIPKTKKGYSGVGVYVRKSCADDPFLNNLLSVRKVEEGINGSLKFPIDKKYSYRDAPIALFADDLIGAYPTEHEDPEVDFEGRCVLVELNYNIVVISLYCPANSMGTEEMELFRLKFLKALIERCTKLIKAGKEVIVMGDVNVSRDLIDSDEYIKEGIKLDCISRVVDINDHMTPDEVGQKFEKQNSSQVVEFRERTQAKQLINGIVKDSYFDKHFTGTTTASGIFIDTLRQTQKRRLKMYTCWNTLKNFRSINSGSRIDHILATPSLTDNCHADIWNHLMGSDHCPIFCDFNLEKFVEWKEAQPEAKSYVMKPKKFKFEAATFYGVDNGGNSIDKFFGKHGVKRSVMSESEDNTKDKNKDPSPISSTSDTPTPTTIASNETKPSYTSRKKPKKIDSNQQSINNFFFNPHEAASSEQEQEKEPLQPSQSTPVSVASFMDLLSSGKCGGPPNCLHNEPATLRTSQKAQTKGKKFWCCARSATSETFDADADKILKEDRCDFFKWVTK